MKRLIVLLMLYCATASAGWQEVLPNATLLGEGDLRFLGFRIYTARLWSAAKPFNPDSPFALELTYHRSISRERFVDTSLDEIRRIYGDKISDSVLQQWQAEMQQAFVDVEPGQRIIGVYLPGRAARFYAGEKLQYEVKDPAFAKAFFAIWLDPRTRDQGLRQKLLGAG